MRHNWRSPCFTLGLLAGWLALTGATPAQEKKELKKQPAKKAVKEAAPIITYPPTLPDGKTFASDTSPLFLQPPATLVEGVTIAKTAPQVDFAYFPGQDYEGKPWSNWGDSTAAGGKYYTAIGDHLAPQGNALVFEYNPANHEFRTLAETAKILELPEGHYKPGKIHTRLDMGRDGWIYFSTHRGSPRVTNDQYHYKGDWIFRANPTTGKSEIVVHAPVEKHCIPNGTLDTDRLIFYGGTAPGAGDAKDIRFFAYDCANHKLLYSGPNGPARYMMLSKSTGKVYYVPGAGDSPIMRFDPTSPEAPVEIPGSIGVRAATRETPQGIIYTVSLGQGDATAEIYAFDVKTEKATKLGTAAVGVNDYVAAVDADPSGRYLYYVPGAHGGSEKDNSAVVQFDTQTRQKKVIAFLHPFYEQKYKCIPKGTYAVAVDPSGDKLYVTWNVSRGSRAWDCCAVTTIHIPSTERPQ